MGQCDLQKARLCTPHWPVVIIGPQVQIMDSQVQIMGIGSNCSLAGETNQGKHFDCSIECPSSGQEYFFTLVKVGVRILEMVESTSPSVLLSSLQHFQLGAFKSSQRTTEGRGQERRN